MRKLNYIDNGNGFDFGKISEEYGKYRDIYPDEFFEKIYNLNLCGRDKVVLDLGTGTGVLPRHLEKYGGKFIGADISENQINQARKLSQGMDIEYIISPAEKVEFPEKSIDTVMACMCFTYFNKDILLPNIYRMLMDKGRFSIMSMVYLPGESDIAKGSEDLILKYNSSWNGGGYGRPKFDNDGIPSTYDVDTSLFEVDKAFDFDIPIKFTRESWHGRIIAARGIGASSLSDEQKKSFENEHIKFMKKQPKTFEVMHSVTFCVMKKV